MRDTHDDMIELLDVKFDENIYSSLVKCIIDNELLKLRFFILPTDYSRLRKIFEFRPFENTGVSPYRYFFTFSYRKDSIDPELAFADIRVEQLKNHKQFEFPLSRKYISNLLWIKTIQDKKIIMSLIEE